MVRLCGFEPRYIPHYRLMGPPDETKPQNWYLYPHGPWYFVSSWHPWDIFCKAESRYPAPWLAPSSRLLVCLKKSNLILHGTSMVSGSGPCTSFLPTLPAAVLVLCSHSPIRQHRNCRCHRLRVRPYPAPTRALAVGEGSGVDTLPAFATEPAPGTKSQRQSEL